MYKQKFNVILQGPFEESVRLGIPRKSGFWVGDCHYYDYNWTKEEAYLNVDVYIYRGDLSDKATVRRQARLELERSNKIINFLFDYKIVHEYPSMIGKLQQVTEIGATPIATKGNIYKIHRILGALSNVNFEERDGDQDSKRSLQTKKKFYSAMNYFVRGMDAVDIELYEDSYLNFYRGLELLAREHYIIAELGKKLDLNLKKHITSFVNEALNENFGERHSNVYQNAKKVIMDGFITDNRKIKLAARDLGMAEKDLELIEPFCRLRNSLSHGNNEGVDVEIEDIALGKYLVRFFAAKMLLGLSKEDVYDIYPAADIAR